MYRSFEDLEVWRRACALAIRVYRGLVDCRDDGLRDQMQRSGVSIASNIAEGAERGGNDSIRYLAIARGSAAELRTRAYIASQVGILPDATTREIMEESHQITKMLYALARSLRNRSKPHFSDPRRPNLQRNPDTENRALKTVPQTTSLPAGERPDREAESWRERVRIELTHAGSSHAQRF